MTLTPRTKHKNPQEEAHRECEERTQITGMQDMEATRGREGQLGENLGAGLCRTEDPDDQQVFLADRCKAVNWPFLGGGGGVSHPPSLCQVTGLII